MSIQTLSPTYSPTYLSQLLDRVSRTKKTGANDSVDWLQALRDRSANWVRDAVIPTTRDEEWRFTDLSVLRQSEFDLAQPVQVPFFPELVLPEAANSRLVFVNGIYAPELSNTQDLPERGVVLSNLGKNLPDRCGSYLGQAPGAQEVFTALNTAGLKDLAVIWVERNVVVSAPIHLLFISKVGEEMTISQPRCLVVAEVGSQLSFVEEYINLSINLSDRQVGYFTNSVTEIWLDENAQVNHTRIVKEGDEAIHIGKTAVTQARSSRYTHQAIAFGGKLSRHNLEIWQTGEQTETTLNGLTVIDSHQVADTHSLIALNHPHGISRQLHKFIIGDRAHGVFNGKILVPKAAQLTDAAQLNRNLLLSPKARIDTKPQLEITADNVKCAHGATVSQLEDDEIFYLQARGINAEDARQLLVHAFAQEIIHQIPFPSLRNNLLSKIKQNQAKSNSRFLLNQ